MTTIMERQQYTKPGITVQALGSAALMSASGEGVTTTSSDSDVRLDYGGNDTDGTVTPSAKHSLIDWDD